MAAPIVISILANASQANRTLEQTATKTQRIGAGFRKMGVPAVAALGAITVAGKKASDAAVEDANSQALLASSLRKTTGATDRQVRSTEKFIDKTARAVGVADDELRPALQNLARATGSVKKAQDSLGLALDISAETGADVVSVSKALAKGYAGNTGALGKMLPGLDKGILKTGDMAKITDELARLTGGKAAAAAKTEAGERRRSNVAMDESIETIGKRLIPVYAKGTKIIAEAADWLAKHERVTTLGAAALGGLAVSVLLVNAAMKVGSAVSAVYSLAQKVLTKSTDETTRSINRTRVGAGLAGAALVGLGQSGAVGEGGLKRVTTAAGAAAVGFAVAGPWGAVVGAGAVLLGIGRKSAESAALQEKFRSIQSKITTQAAALTATLDTQTGAITKNTKVSIAKALADSGAYTSATKLGLSLNTVTQAALGNKAAQEQVTAATNAYIAKQVEGKKGVEEWTTALAKARNVTEPLTGSVTKFSGELGRAKTASNQAKSAIEQMSRGAENSAKDMAAAGRAGGQGFALGLLSWKTQVSIAGATLGSAAARAARKALDSHSPSRVFYDIGDDAGEGFALGIEASGDRAVAAMELTAKRTAKAAQLDLSAAALRRGSGDLAILAGAAPQPVSNTYLITVEVTDTMSPVEQGRKFAKAIKEFERAQGRGR